MEMSWLSCHRFKVGEIARMFLTQTRFHSSKTHIKMGKWFYTDSSATQQGPVTEEGLLRLNREREIVASSLVWKDGLDEWTPFGKVAGSVFGFNEEGEPISIGVCAYSGQVFNAEELIPYGQALVGLKFKDEFVQQMMEQGAVDIEDATDNPLSFVGFWWRTLSSSLDYLVKIIPSYIFMIPYYIASASVGISLESGDIDLEESIGMIIAAGVGGLANLAFSVFYETWMVGKYQATLGKMIIGAKVVNPDGSRITYKKAFLRWLAKKPLNNVIVWAPSMIGFAVVITAIGAASSQSDAAAMMAMSVLVGIFVFAGLLVLCSGVYWMSAFDAEKRALHDRAAGTRVIKK